MSMISRNSIRALALTFSNALLAKGIMFLTTILVSIAVVVGGTLLYKTKLIIKDYLEGYRFKENNVIIDSIRVRHKEVIFPKGIYKSIIIKETKKGHYTVYIK